MNAPTFNFYQFLVGAYIFLRRSSKHLQIVCCSKVSKQKNRWNEFFSCFSDLELENRINFYYPLHPYFTLSTHRTWSIVKIRFQYQRALFYFLNQFHCVSSTYDHRKDLKLLKTEEIPYLAMISSDVGRSYEYGLRSLSSHVEGKVT